MKGEPGMAGESQFKLLGERRFAPLFWTQFLGAANDNLFKFAFTLLATYHAAEWGGGDPATVGFVIGGIFIPPFPIFPPTSEQVAGQPRKGGLIRLGKGPADPRVPLPAGRVLPPPPDAPPAPR